MASWSRYEARAGGGPMQTPSSASRTGRESRSASEKTIRGEKPASRHARSNPSAISPPPVEDADRAFRPHHGDLGGRPGEVEVRADVLRSHDAVGAAVGLAGDDGDLGDGRLRERVEELRAVLDDAAVLLVRPGEKPRH